MAQEASRGGGRPVEVRVRSARRADAAALAAFFMQAWKEAGPGALGFTGATDESIKEIASEEFLAQRLMSPRVRIVVAEREKRIQGFASIRALNQGEVELTGIVVLQSTSGMGLGTKLLRRACDLAVKLGFRKVIVMTEVFNKKAIGFYKKNGFTEKRK